MAFDVKVFRSVDEIGQDAINSIATDDAFYTYEWFKILETQHSFRNSPFYLAVYENRKLSAFTVCFIDWTDNYFFVLPHLRYVTPFLKNMLIFGQKHGFCQEHILLCYSPSCDRSKVLQENNSEKKIILSLVAEKINVICRKERFLFSSFLFVSEFDKLLIAGLQDSSYLKSTGITTFYLNVRWSSFEEYLKSMKKSHRKNIRNKIKKCVENGVSIEEQEFHNFSTEKLSKLIQNLNLKYNKNARNVNPAFFHKIDEYAAEKIKLFIAKKNNEVVGFSLLFRQGDTVDAWMCGFEYEALSKTDYVYFNLVYYASIQWAINEGIKKIYFRNSAEKAKLDWGCEPEETFSFVKFHDALLGPVVNGGLRTPFWIYLSRFLLRKD